MNLIISKYLLFKY